MPETPEILLIEDNSGDVRLMQEAFRQNKVRAQLRVVSDGVEAMAYLLRKGNYMAAPRPDLILLDLNLPKKDGREVLAEIKQDEKLKAIPIIVLTTSRAEQDIHTSYSLHANCYMIKPAGFHELLGVVKAVRDFWLAQVTLPVRTG